MSDGVRVSLFVDPQELADPLGGRYGRRSRRAVHRAVRAGVRARRAAGARVVCDLHARGGARAFARAGRERRPRSRSRQPRRCFAVCLISTKCRLATRWSATRCLSASRRAFANISTCSLCDVALYGDSSANSQLPRIPTPKAAASAMLVVVAALFVQAIAACGAAGGRAVDVSLRRRAGRSTRSPSSRRSARLPRSCSFRCSDVRRKTGTPSASGSRMRTSSRLRSICAGLSDPGDSKVLGGMERATCVPPSLICPRAPTSGQAAIGIAGASLGASLARYCGGGRSVGSFARAHLPVARLPRRSHRGRDEAVRRHGPRCSSPAATTRTRPALCGSWPKDAAGHARDAIFGYHRARHRAPRARPRHRPSAHRVVPADAGVWTVDSETVRPVGSRMRSDSIVFAIAGMCFGIILGWVIGTQQAARRTARRSSSCSLGPRHRSRARTSRRPARGSPLPLDEGKVQGLRPSSRAIPRTPAPTCSSATHTSTPSAMPTRSSGTKRA